MKKLSLNQLKNRLGKYARSGAKLVLWTAQGQLRHRLHQWREHRLISESGLFDTAFYLAQTGDFGNVDPITHYLEVGAAQGLSPMALFDTGWYSRRYPDVAQARLNPFFHFLQDGWRERRDPHPLFETSYYLEGNPAATRNGLNPLAHYWKSHASASSPYILFDQRRYLEQNPDVLAAGCNPLVHYLESGWREHRSPHPLFQTRYYLQQNPDVSESGANPLIHFVTSGFRENRNPNPLFDCRAYREFYSDVSGSETNPLIHYILNGARENRVPHPLFDPSYYRSQLKAAAVREPLEHYLEVGIAERLNPHPLVDANFYSEQMPPELVRTSNPVQHYVEAGATLGFDPCPLFDTSYYLNSYGEARNFPGGPLVHYLRIGAAEGYRPNPLFDSAYYLSRNADVRASGQNPLTHFLLGGAAEGRNPNPFFDTLFYLRTNPTVRRLGINPLVHYLRLGGAEEGRDPSAFFKLSEYLKNHPDLRPGTVNYLVHFLAAESHPQHISSGETSLPNTQTAVTLKLRGLKATTRGSRREGRPVICVSHVSPAFPRAGNEYRINRLLHWLNARGYSVTPVISPLPGITLPESELEEIAEKFGNAVLCNRTGSISAIVDHPAKGILESLDGKRVEPRWNSLPNGSESVPTTETLFEADVTFCHDALVEVVTALASAIKPCIVLVEYIFMSRLLPLVGKQTLRIIDTHDVFSSKSKKVLGYGISDSLSLTAEEESGRLLRADLILAIQPEEQRQLEAITGGERKVITVGVDFPRSGSAEKSTGHKVVFIASNNSMNAHGLRDFLRFCWPSVLAQVPEAELIVAGTVSSTVLFPHRCVTLLGPVDDIGSLYAESRVAINPALAGTGLKIKTLECLSYFRPLVTWPTGIDGLHPSLASLCTVALDWFEFQERLIRILLDSKEEWFSAEQKATVEHHLAATTVYGALTQELDSFFDCPSDRS